MRERRFFKINSLVEHRFDFELVLEFWKVCQEPAGIKTVKKTHPSSSSEASKHFRRLLSFHSKVKRSDTHLTDTVKRTPVLTISGR